MVQGRGEVELLPEVKVVRESEAVDERHGWTPKVTERLTVTAPSWTRVCAAEAQVEETSKAHSEAVAYSTEGSSSGDRVDRDAASAVACCNSPPNAVAAGVDSVAELADDEDSHDRDVAGTALAQGCRASPASARTSGREAARYSSWSGPRRRGEKVAADLLTVRAASAVQRAPNVERDVSCFVRCAAACFIKFQCNRSNHYIREIVPKHEKKGR